MANESFLWKKISENEKEDIKNQAKKILNDFASKLEKIKVEGEHFQNKASPSGTREQGEGWETPEEFRDVMFANAPDVKDDAIVAEKGAWK